MARLLVAMVACLTLGAGGMWVLSNFKVKFEPIGGPDRPPATVLEKAAPQPAVAAPVAEPEQLPPHLLAPRVPAPTPGIQQAGGFAPSAVDVGALGIGQPPAVVPVTPDEILKVTDDGKGLVWENPSGVLFLGGDKPSVVLNQLVGSTFQVEFNNLVTSPTPTAANGLVNLPLDLSKGAAPGTPFVVKITRTVSPAAVVTARMVSSITVVRPLPAGSFFVDTVATTDGLPTAATATPVDIFGTHVRLRGRAIGSFKEPRFLLVLNSKTVEVPQATAVAPVSPSGDWEYRLTLPAFNVGDQPKVVTRGDFNGGHSYSAADVTLRVNLLPATLPPPTIAVRTADDKGDEAATGGQQTAGLPTYLLNRRRLKVNVTPANADAKAVRLYLDDRLVATQPTNAASAVPFEIPDVGAGRDHVIRAAVGIADKSSQAAQVAVKVVTTRPQVEAVLAPGFGGSNGVGTEKILVRFNSENALAKASAETAANFEVRSLNDADTAPRLQGVPSFDATTNSVTLTVNKIVPGSYAVRVRTVTDVYGNAIDPVPGTTAGFAFETTLFTNTVDAPQPSAPVGVTPGLPAHVPLGEYLKPRPFVEGFNPSDRVESRVVRLYYSRDAHLVVQTINRDAKSYNGASVDIRRRAADLARSDANGAQDLRQAYERAAVQAAGEARTAETEMRVLEAQLQSARTQEATARVQLVQREQQLADARRELDRTVGGTETRAAADPRVVTQQKLVTDLNASVNAANAAVVAQPDNVAVAERRNQLVASRDSELARLQQLVQAAQAADRQNDPLRQSVRRLEDEAALLRQVQSSANAVTTDLTSQIARKKGDIQSLRATENAAREKSVVGDRDEQRRREDQVRREVAASTANPATVAVPKPDSADPVAQCELTVIGEGLIQVRGPVKGLNAIRTMINQIDAPTGQVRVGVHTVQVNGERVDRMDKVVTNIQRYIDHSRFLTAQSAQMLRTAVTTVAGRKAVEATTPGCTQDDRDQKYLYNFFGKDFIDELKALDSEFLRTGNKVLSLHSMDSTSLSSALFLMSLARNDVREEILAEFQGQLQTKLPQVELDKFISGLSCPSKCEACFDRAFCMLSQNAKFPSFLGFFGAEVHGADTLTPVQREFVRLAQIFKARLVTEIELKQRVTERTLLESRVGNAQEEQRKAKEQEDAARDALSEVQAQLQSSIVSASVAFGEIQKLSDEVETGLSEQDQTLRLIFAGTHETVGTVPVPKTTPTQLVTRKILGEQVELPQFKWSDGDTYYLDLRDAKYDTLVRGVDATIAYIRQFDYRSADTDKAFQAALAGLTTLSTERVVGLDAFSTMHANLIRVLALIRQESAATRAAINGILSELRRTQPAIGDVLTKYNAFRDDILAKLRDGERLKTSARTLLVGKVNPTFASLQQTFVKSQAATRVAQLTRQPVDAKKLLDMLVDDMEEKLIDLLDGTRAHTANVDNYLKALSTALDDDFNTQFYQPAFQKIRTLGANWAVSLGQIESTTVLTNNRVLGKVSPAASFEFDLPRREILIKEAFKGAKAAVQDYGALLNDPVFLSLVKMYGANPVGAQYGGFGGLPAVRNALPGLPGSADEMIMAQAGTKRPEFGTHLEALIPDPSVFKIETGTGYEVRPVISPDGQAVVFALDYMYTTDVREPVRADEKHLGRVKRHFLHTDVQLSNFELREVSKYWVSTKLARTGRGVQLLQDIPVAGALFRPAPSAGSALQENLIYSQATVFPTLFDLMGLRYAQAVADLNPDALINDEFVVRGRREYLRHYIFDYGASKVDDALRIMYGERRADLYRSQFTIPAKHPNGYRGPGLFQRDAELQEGYDPRESYPPSRSIPGMHQPQFRDRDPADRFDGIPPGVTVPGHPQLGGRPTGPLPPRDFNANNIGTQVNREPLPRNLAPLPKSDTLKAPRPAGTPTLAPPPTSPLPLPAGPASVPSLPPLIEPKSIPTVPAVRGQMPYPSDPAPLPSRDYFPR